MKTTHINHNVLKVQLIIAALSFLIANCDRSEQLLPPDQSLVGTVWKLEGFGADNNTLTVAQPHNEESYLLHLQKNVNAFGITSVNTFRAEYKVDTTLGTLTIGLLGTTKINEQQDGQRYVDCLSRIKRYQHDDATLRLYYSDTEYLQYRPATDDTSFRKKITELFGEIVW